MNHSLSIELIASEYLDDLWNLITNMAYNMAYPSYFCSGDWLKAAKENLRPEDKPFFLLVKRYGQVKAILPLINKRNALGGIDFHFLGTDYHPDPLGLICSPTDRRESAIALKQFLLCMPGWDRFFLDWILYDEVEDWELPFKPISIEPFKILPHNFDEILCNFKKKKRYNLRTMVRKFKDAGGEFLISMDSTSHNIFFEALLSLHRKRAEEKAIVSSIDDTGFKILHRCLIEGSENVNFYGLKLNDQLIAVIYGFKFDNRYFYYQIAHDPNYGGMSPGAVLLFLVIEDCCLKGISEFNFLQGDESYKGTWTEDSRVLYQCILKRETWRSRLLGAIDQANEARKIVLKWRERGN